MVQTSMCMAVRVRGNVKLIIWKRYLFSTTVKMFVAYLRHIISLC